MPSISAALHDLLNDQALTVDAALSRHFGDAYRQSTNGEWIDRAAFAAQIEQLRAVIDHVEIEVLDELVDGSAYAERHIVRVTQRGGGTGGQQVFVFAKVGEDGRFVSLEEATLPLPAEAGDGSAV